MEEEGITNVRITGKESNEDIREENKRRFQEDDDVQACLITKAGAASLNLQAAPYLVCFDLPWSIGELTQVIGRIHRFKSKHNSVVVSFLMAHGSLDDFVFRVLMHKQSLAEQIVGTDIEELDKMPSVSPDEFWKFIRMVKRDPKRFQWLLGDGSIDQLWREVFGAGK